MRLSSGRSPPPLALGGSLRLGLPPRYSPRSPQNSVLRAGSVASDADVLNSGMLLHQAVHNNEQYLIMAAIDRGSGVDFYLDEETEPAVRTPLRAACYTGNLDAARMLLARGAQAFAGFHNDSWTALHSAAAGGHEEMMKALLCETDELHEGTMLDGFTLSHIVVESLNTALTNNDGADFLGKMLRKRPGIAVDVCSERLGYLGWTPLHLACARGCGKAAALLLKFGAHINARTEDFYIGSYRLFQFVGRGLSQGPQIAECDPEFDTVGVQWLDKGLLPIHLAALGGHLHVVSFLSKRGQSINITTVRQRWTPLMFAVWSGKESLVRDMCRLGARDVVNVGDRRGDGSEWTPLALAVVRSTPGTVQALVDYGADPLMRLRSADFPGRSFIKLCPPATGEVPDQWSGADQRISLIHLAVVRGDVEMLRKVIAVVRAAHTKRAPIAESPRTGGRSPGSPRSCRSMDYTPRCEGAHYDPVAFTTAEGWSPAILAILLQMVDPHRRVCGAEFLQSFPDRQGGASSRADVFLELLGTGRSLLEDRPTSSPPVVPQRFPEVSEGVIISTIDELVRLCRTGSAEQVADRILHTTLCVACRFNRMRVVQHLLETGLCDPRCEFLRPVECRPLHVATACGFGDLAQLLLEHRADVLECDESAEYPLHKLTRYYQEQITSLQEQLAEMGTPSMR